MAKTAVRTLYALSRRTSPRNKVRVRFRQSPGLPAPKINTLKNAVANVRTR